MRASLRSIANQVVLLLMVTFVSMSMAMAAYICPQTPPPVAVVMEMPEGVPCAEMDREQPTPMRVGVNTMSFMWKSPARAALEALAREGYRCFELMAQRPHFDPYMEPADAVAFGRFLRDAGLRATRVESVNVPRLSTIAVCVPAQEAAGRA